MDHATEGMKRALQCSLTILDVLVPGYELEGERRSLQVPEFESWRYPPCTRKYQSGDSLYTAHNLASLRRISER